mmetsp:Transcript_94761/g.203599  ORF Transcript_94761/g.203599 Transcript_94761/m.203599 type:complete len:301 (-) Transcript_94761:52-954(-)
MVGGGARSELAGRAYGEALRDLARHTSVRVTDIDYKAVQLLDALHARGRALEACEHLKVSLEGIKRERIMSWRAYVYTLLRKFDEEAYSALKGPESQRRTKATNTTVEELHAEPQASVFNPTAMEFVPGQFWTCPLTVSTTPASRQQEGVVKAECGAIAVSCTSTSTGTPGGKGSEGDAMSGEDLGDGSPTPVLRLESALAELMLSPGLASLPSAGSAAHQLGQCKPCAFVWSKGCDNGQDCTFCHICGPGEKKRRTKERLKRSKEAQLDGAGNAGLGLVAELFEAQQAVTTCGMTPPPR